MIETVIDKLVHGGQGLGTLPDGRKVFVWNALPGERVMVELGRQKKSWAEGTAVEILSPSPERIAPREAEYLATSPWQIMDFAAENRYKAEIVREIFAGIKLDLPDFTVMSDGREWGYRNKMEYSFYGDDQGLHLALHVRGTHRKVIVEGSLLASPTIVEAGMSLVGGLQALGVRAADLKSAVIRSSKSGAAAALYVKQKSFPKLKLPASLSGLKVYYSDPRSPASVPTKQLYETGDTGLKDDLLGKNFDYGVDSFFQVNVPVFEIALKKIIEQVPEGKAVDMYSGVGSIGLSLPAKRLTMVDIDPSNIAMAKINAGHREDVKIIEASTENALEYIASDSAIVFDPPRSGLHTKITQRLTEVMPPKIVYLSCNPATQARDIAVLSGLYSVSHFSVYNFFPRTPHIETLAVLELQ